MGSARGDAPTAATTGAGRRRFGGFGVALALTGLAASIMCALLIALLLRSPDEGFDDDFAAPLAGGRSTEVSVGAGVAATLGIDGLTVTVEPDATEGAGTLSMGSRTIDDSPPWLEPVTPGHLIELDGSTLVGTLDIELELADFPDSSTLLIGSRASRNAPWGIAGGRVEDGHLRGSLTAAGEVAVFRFDPSAAALAADAAVDSGRRPRSEVPVCERPVSPAPVTLEGDPAVLDACFDAMPSGDVVARMTASSGRPHFVSGPAPMTVDAESTELYELVDGGGDELFLPAGRSLSVQLPGGDGGDLTIVGRANSRSTATQLALDFLTATGHLLDGGTGSGPASESDPEAVGMTPTNLMVATLDEIACLDLDGGRDEGVVLDDLTSCVGRAVRRVLGADAPAALVVEAVEASLNEARTSTERIGEVAGSWSVTLRRQSSIVAVIGGDGSVNLVGARSTPIGGSGPPPSELAVAFGGESIAWIRDTPEGRVLERWDSAIERTVAVDRVDPSLLAGATLVAGTDGILLASADGTRVARLPRAGRPVVEPTGLAGGGQVIGVTADGELVMLAPSSDQPPRSAVWISRSGRARRAGELGATADSIAASQAAPGDPIWVATTADTPTCTETSQLWRLDLDSGAITGVAPPTDLIDQPANRRLVAIDVSALAGGRALATWADVALGCDAGEATAWTTISTVDGTRPVAEELAHAQLVADGTLVGIESTPFVSGGRIRSQPGRLVRVEPDRSRTVLSESAIRTGSSGARGVGLDEPVPLLLPSTAPAEPISDSTLVAAVGSAFVSPHGGPCDGAPAPLTWCHVETVRSLDTVAWTVVAPDGRFALARALLQPDGSWRAEFTATPATAEPSVGTSSPTASPIVLGSSGGTTRQRMSSRFGQPTFDTGWTTACEGSPESAWRTASWGGLSLVFERRGLTGTDDVVSAWSWRLGSRGRAGLDVTLGPLALDDGELTVDDIADSLALPVIDDGDRALVPGTAFVLEADATTRGPVTLWVPAIEACAPGA